MRKNVYLVALLVLVFLVPAAAQNKPFAFGVIGDSGCDCSGQGVVSKAMFEWFKKRPYGMVLMLGDNIYVNTSLFGGKRGGDAGLFEEHFDEYYKPLLDSGVKFFATLGNHDMEADNGRSMIADKKRFHMIGNTGFYSFEPEDEKGLITFFAVNSVSLVKGRTHQLQIDWLRESLQKTKTTWKVVFMHHPIYTAVGGHRIDPGLQKTLEGILIEGGVQLVLSGHNHYYARSKKIHGITHITSGGAGRSLVSVKSSGQMEKAIRSYHFMYFEASYGRLDYWTIDGTGSEIDRGFLEPKPTELKPNPASQ